ncbi:MAG: hypothetical protein KAH32_06255, partial [Chlamydiia bacterium]|nr:hypothetical protein [Chlamydiia bacterium]
IGFTKGIGRFNISDYSLMLSLLYNLKRYGDGYSIMFSAGVGCTFNIFKIQRQNDSQESLNKFKDSMISKLYITSNSIFRGLFIEELDKMISIGPVCKLDVGAKYFNQSVEISAGHSFRTYTDIKSKIFEIKNPDQKLSEVKNILDTTTNSLYYKGSTGIRIKYVAYIKGECISIFIFSEIEAKSLGGLTLKEGNSYIPKLTLSSGVFPDIKPSGNTGAYDNIYLHFLKYSIRSSVKTKLGIGCSLYV